VKLLNEPVLSEISFKMDEEAKKKTSWMKTEILMNFNVASTRMGKMMTRNLQKIPFKILKFFLLLQHL